MEKSEQISAILDASIASLCALCHVAWQKNLMPGWSGNASIRMAENILLTAKGAPKGFLTGSDCLVLNQAGEIVWGKGTPSSESGLHLGLYNAVQSCGAILHTHPKALQSLDIMENGGLIRALKSLPLYEAEMWLPKLGVSARATPGTDAVATAAVTAMPLGDVPFAIWMPGHGLVTLGKRLLDCLCLSEELEHLAAIALQTRPPRP